MLIGADANALNVCGATIDRIGLPAQRAVMFVPADPQHRLHYQNRKKEVCYSGMRERPPVIRRAPR